MTRTVSISALHFFVCATKAAPSLFACLESLRRQESTGEGGPGSVTIVWNIPETEAREESLKVDAWADAHLFAMPLHHCVEDHRGIPYARNKALSVARERGLEWLAFIDDDCVADHHLAKELALAASESGALVVAGGWELVPASTPSSWLPDSVFGVKHYQIEGKDAPGGSSIPTAYTRNVLLNLPEVDRLKDSSQFDTSLASTGGSDATYFFEVSRAGGRIVYAPQAKVFETYSGKRLSLAWHFRRRVRNTQQKIIRARVTGEKVFSPELLVSTLWRIAWRAPLSILALPLAARSARVRRWIGSTVLMSSPFLAAVLLAFGVRFREYAPSRQWALSGREG